VSLPTTDDHDTNEIIAETRALEQQRAAVAAMIESAKAKRWPLATIGLGIGSAAVVAALLYANRHWKK
jgi:hypothetical protein